MTHFSTDLQHRLYAVAYKMTGEHHNSQDLCQMVWERYHRLPAERVAQIEDVPAYLCRMVINAALDYLRQVQKERAAYPGVWLPEPILQDEPNPALDVPYGLTVLLSRLQPLERAVFLLRASFGYPYQIGTWLDCTPEHCRQLYHRAAPKLQRASQQPLPEPQQQEALLAAFSQAAQEGNLTPLLELLRADVALYSDGGGKVAAARQVLHGRATVQAFIQGLHQKLGGGLAFRLCWVNNQIGVHLSDAAGVQTLVLMDVLAGEIEVLYLVRNPDKLGLS